MGSSRVLSNVLVQTTTGNPSTGPSLIIRIHQRTAATACLSCVRFSLSDQQIMSPATAHGRPLMGQTMGPRGFAYDNYESDNGPQSAAAVEASAAEAGVRREQQHIHRDDAPMTPVVYVVRYSNIQEPTGVCSRVRQAPTLSSRDVSSCDTPTCETAKHATVQCCSDCGHHHKHAHGCITPADDVVG